MSKVVLRGQVYWASIRRPNKRSGKLQLDLGNMDKASLALLKKEGVPTKNKDDDRGDFITLKGSPEYPPKVVDSRGNTMPEPVSLGNGTKVKVPFKTYEWKFQGDSGTSVGLNSVMVLDLVVFDTDELEAEDGYVQEDLAQETMEPEVNGDDPF